VLWQSLEFCGNRLFNVKVLRTVSLICTGTESVKRYRLELYDTLYECGECGCNCECQCNFCCNMKHVDVKLGSLFEVC